MGYSTHIADIYPYECQLFVKYKNIENTKNTSLTKSCCFKDVGFLTSPFKKTTEYSCVQSESHLDPWQRLFYFLSPSLTKCASIYISVCVSVYKSVCVCALTLMTPGQLGPMRRVVPWRRSLCLTLTMSCWGMPSVMHTTRGISASMASMMAAAANGGGT